MKFTKEKKSNEEIVQTLDVELNEEQLDTVSGGVTEGIVDGCTSGPKGSN